MNPSVDLVRVKLSREEVEAARDAHSGTSGENDFRRSTTYVMPTSQPKGELHKRTIILDGQNICYDDWNHFHFDRLLTAIKYFEQLRFKTIVIWPKNREEILYRDEQWSVLCELKSLIERGILIQTPEYCYDDFFMVDYGARSDSIIVSNDHFYDVFASGTHSHRTQIMERRLPYCFIEDEFMLPLDPLGKIGPKLPEFLHFKRGDYIPPKRVYFDEFSNFLTGM